MSKASLPLLVTVTSQFIFRSIRCTIFRITGSSSTSKTCPSVTLHKTFVKYGGRKTQCAQTVVSWSNRIYAVLTWWYIILWHRSRV
jgi:hypothetical protein